MLPVPTPIDSDCARYLGAALLILVAFRLDCDLAAGEAMPVASDADADWLRPLFAAATQAAHDRNEVKVAESVREDATLAVESAEGQFNPTLTVTPSYEDNQSLSNNVLSGPDYVRTRTGTASATVSKNFASGTAVNVGTSSALSRSDGSQVISSSFFTSSVYLTVAQQLLHGGNRDANLEPIRIALDALAVNRDQVDTILEGVLGDLADRWLALALADASITQLRAAVRQSKDSLAQHEERLRTGLSRGLDVLSLRRGLVDQEVPLSTAQRAFAAQVRQFGLYWPGLVPPDRSCLLKTALPALPALVTFATTRDGIAITRLLDAADRTVRVTADGSLDNLSLSTTLTKGGGDPTFGGSWHQVGDRQSYDFLVGLTYTHVFGNAPNVVAYQQSLLARERAHFTARIAERDWTAIELQLRDAFTDALSSVAERERQLTAAQDELQLTAAQVEANRATTQLLIDAQQRVSDAVLARAAARIAVLSADLHLRQHDHRLLGLLP
jgi:outer membrane protein TolC